MRSYHFHVPSRSRTNYISIEWYVLEVYGCRLYMVVVGVHVLQMVRLCGVNELQGAK